MLDTGAAGVALDVVGWLLRPPLPPFCLAGWVVGCWTGVWLAATGLPS
jgi:hypothetical protein